MEGVLIPGAIAVVDEASVSVVRERVREVGAATGLTEVQTASLVNVASELAQNQRMHARAGVVTVLPLEGRQGVEIVAVDHGPGIASPMKALKSHKEGSAGATLGVGLAAVLELADEVDIDVRIGEGTLIRARKLGDHQPRRPCVGVFGRPIEGERTSGDDATFQRTTSDSLVAVCDGLGHGVEAREASRAAVGALSASADLATMIIHANDAAQRTRGAVVTVARLGIGGAVDLALVGNTAAFVCGRRETRRYSGNPSVLGTRLFKHATIESESLARGELLVLFSDGLSNKLTLEHEDTLLHEHPVIIAEQLAARFGSNRDDVMVLVVA